MQVVVDVRFELGIRFQNFVERKRVSRSRTAVAHGRAEASFVAVKGVEVGGDRRATNE